MKEVLSKIVFYFIFSMMVIVFFVAMHSIAYSSVYEGINEILITCGITFVIEAVSFLIIKRIK